MAGQMSAQMTEEQMAELLPSERLVAECLPYLILSVRPGPGEPPLIPGYLDQIVNIWWKELLKDEPDHGTKSAILQDRAATLIFAFATWMWENVEASTRGDTDRQSFCRLIDHVVQKFWKREHGDVIIENWHPSKIRDPGRMIIERNAQQLEPHIVQSRLDSLRSLTGAMDINIHWDPPYQEEHGGEQHGGHYNDGQRYATEHYVAEQYDGGYDDGEEYDGYDEYCHSN